MKPTESCYNIIKKWEGLKTLSYLCPAGIPTIGYGSTFYANGSKVKLGEVITLECADKLMMFEVDKLALKLVNKADFNQNQFNAIVSLCYNIGLGAFEKSTLLKKAKINVNDASIRDEFMKWVKGGGKTLPGLVKRRKEEADLYFTP
jgi:lysozyme